MGLLRRNKTESESPEPELSDLFLGAIHYAKIFGNIEFNYGWKKNGETYTAHSDADQVTLSAEAMSEGGFISEQKIVPAMVMLNDATILAFKEKSEVYMKDGLFCFKIEDMIRGDQSKYVKENEAEEEKDEKRAKRKEKWDNFTTNTAAFTGGLMWGLRR